MSQAHYFRREFASDSSVAGILESARILDKWYLAPYLCAGQTTPVPFDRGADPIQGFRELIQIRNWLAHPKVETFLEGTLDPKSSISDCSSGEEYPWPEMLKGEKWGQTEIPKNPFEIDYSHAKAAISILDEMTKTLSEKLRGRIHQGWLGLITVKDADGLHQYRAPVSTIWGGYSGVMR